MTDQPDSIIKLDAERLLSTNFFWRVDVEGQVFDLQTTVRDSTTPEQVEAHMKSVSAALHYVAKHGGTAKAVGSTSYQKPAQESHGETKPAEPSIQLPPNSFVTTAIAVTETNGKKYFRIKGQPPYHKYGVTVWPEVLGEVEDVNAMSGGNEHPLAGYIATFSLKEDGKPEKITKLEKIT